MTALNTIPSGTNPGEDEIREATMLAYQNLNKPKGKDGSYQMASRVKFVDCCIYLSTIPKFSSARPVSSMAGGNCRSSGSASGGGNGGSGYGNLGTAADDGSRTGLDGGDGSSPTAAVGNDGTSLKPMAAMVEVQEANSSLQAAGRPMGAKRKATMGAAESGNGKLARAVDSVGRAIAKNGKSRERVANLALWYRLIRRAGLSDVE
jgi:hypothetical protein